MVSRTLIALVAVVAGGAASPALAQKPAATAPPAADRARAHFERGVELYQEGSYDGALVEFERYYELTANYKILFNLAQVQAERHEYVAAIGLLKEYLAKGGSQIPVERRQHVLQDLDRLEQRIATLAIEVNVDGAEVFVNGRSVGLSPLPDAVPVNVGACPIKVEKAGYVTLQKSIDVAGGDRSHIVLSLVRARPAPAAPVSGPRTAPRSPDGPRAHRVVGTTNLTPFWIGLSATAVLGAATATFGGLTVDARHQLDDSLGTLPGDSDKIEADRNRLQTMAWLTDGFGAATIVAAGTALYFLIDPPISGEAHPVQGGPAAVVAPTPSGIHLFSAF